MDGRSDCARAALVQGSTDTADDYSWEVGGGVARCCEMGAEKAGWASGAQCLPDVV
jgi:hypothetical protein